MIEEYKNNYDWEVAYNNAVSLWPLICASDVVISRRSIYHNMDIEILDGFNERKSCFNDNWSFIVNFFSKKWADLFDEWNLNRTEFRFQNAHSLLFFAKILHADHPVFIRGQYNHEWKIQSSRKRLENTDTGILRTRDNQAAEFISLFKESDTFKKSYSSSMPKDHAFAILQHYGFPTNFVDFTYSYDVGLYFAEGATNSLPVHDPIAEFGAIFIIPSNAMGPNFKATTLPPTIMRPTLQKGVFIEILNDEIARQFEDYKFTFKHQKTPSWSRLSSIRFGEPVGLDRYLFPNIDPIEELAIDVSEGKTTAPKPQQLGDTIEGVFVGEILNDYLVDGTGGFHIDLPLLFQKCRAQPKETQFALQFFASEIEKVGVDDNGVISSFRFICGGIILAYTIARDVSGADRGDQLPRELWHILERFPFLMDCFHEVTKSANIAFEEG